MTDVEDILEIGDGSEDDDDVDQAVQCSPDERFLRFKEELRRSPDGIKIDYRGYDTISGKEICWSNVKITQMNSDELKHYVEDYKVFCQLRHPKLKRFIAEWVEHERQEMVFITEIVTGGSLRKFIKKVGIPRLNVIKKWTVDILKGLSYLHEQEPPIIHRDLNCCHIYLNSNSSEIRIGELFHARRLTDSLKGEYSGNPQYMAPELIQGQVSSASDIYSLGLCILEMVTSDIPYEECATKAQLFETLSAGRFPAALSRVLDQEVRRFILKCIDHDPQNRPSAATLLADSFLTNIDDAAHKRTVELGMAIDYKTYHQKEIGSDKLTPASSLLDLYQDSPDLNAAGGPRHKNNRKKNNIPSSSTIPNKKKLMLKLNDASGNIKGVEFEFDVRKDTARGVAMEMVHDLMLSETEVPDLAATISRLVENAWGRRGKARPRKSSSIENDPDGEQEKIAEEEEARFFREEKELIRKHKLEMRKLKMRQLHDMEELLKKKHILRKLAQDAKKTQLITTFDAQPPSFDRRKSISQRPSPELKISTPLKESSIPMKISLKLDQVGTDEVTRYIKILQQHLVHMGYRDVIVDGEYGFGTEHAVKLYQEKNGLAVTGEVDEGVWTHILAEGKGSPQLTVCPSNLSDLSL